MHAHIMFKQSCSQFKPLELNGARAYTYIHKQYAGLASGYSLRELIIKEQNNRQEEKKRKTRDVIIVPLAWLVVGQLIFKFNRSILENRNKTS